MFTGLIETTAVVRSLQGKVRGLRLTVNSIRSYEVKKGDSISVDGVCLTAISVTNGPTFDVSPETLSHTTLGNLRVGSVVNLERALRPIDRLGGHIVTGHIDSPGSIHAIRQAGDFTFVVIHAPSDILKMIVKKGSVAVDGISLTVNDVSSSNFSLAIIPHTFNVTNMKHKKEGDKVNIETDIIGKYVARLMNMDSEKGMWKTLAEAGYL
jgi:riboflavin synthase